MRRIAYLRQKKICIIQSTLPVYAPESIALESIALLVQADSSSIPPFCTLEFPPLDVFEGTFVVAILVMDLRVENIVPLDGKPVLVLWVREGIRAPFTARGDIVSENAVPPSSFPVNVVVAAG